MAASESVLGKLHTKLTEVLIEALEGAETPGYVDPETGLEVEGTVLPPSAAVMTVAAKFLKDNNITCEPAEDNELGELQRIMAERQKNLRGKPQLSQADKADILDHNGYAGSA